MDVVVASGAVERAPDDAADSTTVCTGVSLVIEASPLLDVGSVPINDVATASAALETSGEVVLHTTALIDCKK